MNPIIAPIAKTVEVVATWLDPRRREVVILREAVEAALQLLMLLRKQGRYAHFSDAKLAEYEIHYQKRLDAWKDGIS